MRGNLSPLPPQLRRQLTNRINDPSLIYATPDRSVERSPRGQYQRSAAPLTTDQRPRREACRYIALDRTTCNETSWQKLVANIGATDRNI